MSVLSVFCSESLFGINVLDSGILASGEESLKGWLSMEAVSQGRKGQRQPELGQVMGDRNEKQSKGR